MKLSAKNRDKLYAAQRLLADVYADVPDGEIENALSIADSCISDALQLIEWEEIK